MMARAGVNCYARDDGRAADDPASGHPAGSRARRARRHRAAAVRRRSRRRRRGAGADRAPRRPQGPRRRAAHAARPPHRDDRGRERARALRRPHARRAGRVGDRRRGRQAAEARRPTPPTSASGSTTSSSPTPCSSTRSAASACRWSSTRRPRSTGRSSSRTLADQGVDIANGGWGKGSFLRWNRARNDVTKAGQGDRGGSREPTCASSVPGVGSTRSTSTTRTARSRSWCRPTTRCAPRTCPTHLESGKVYVLDGRDRDPLAMEVAVSDLQAQFDAVGLRAAPLGELR